MKTIIAFMLVLALSSIAFSQGWEETLASWYGPRFHGRLTANMEIYDQHALTCAHPTMAFNTRLLIINLDTGRAAIARVNDRGPYIRGRGLDVSFAVAQHLMMVEAGLAKVMIRPLQVIAIPKISKQD